jgi:histone H3/H4
MANRTVQLMNKVTVDDRILLLALRSLLGEHYLPVYNKGYQAMQDYYLTLDKVYKDQVSAATRAGLVLPPSLFRRLLCKGAKRVSLTAPVFFAGMMEEIMSTMLLAAKDVAASQKDKRLTMSHVMAGMQASPLLKHITDNHIHAVIPALPKAPKKAKESSATKSLQLQMLPFKRLCMTILYELEKDKTRFSADFFVALQRYIETYIVQQFGEAYNLARHANRKGVQEKDVQVLLNIHPSTGKSAASVAPVKSMVSGVRRLAHGAGLGPVSPGAVTLMQREMHAHLTAVLNATSMVGKSQRLKTLTVEHLREGLSLQGVCLV